MQVEKEPSGEPGGSPEPRKRRAGLWLERVGVAGFLFFLVKGLLWLIIPLMFVEGCLK